MNKIEKLFNPLPNGDIEINKVELRRHVFLKPIINKPKSKEQVDKLLFIYMMADIGSMYNHLSGDDKLKAVKNHFGYDDMWSVSPELDLAITSYEYLMENSATGSAYLSASKAIYQTGKDLDRTMDLISMLKGSLETRINNVKNNTSFTESEKMENIKEARAYMMEISTAQKTVIDSIKGMPGLINTLKDLATKFAEESNVATQIHGGGDLGNRE